MSVRVEAVEKTYKLGENEVHALKGINLELNKGEFVAFMGPSGSGKTTLLNLIGVLDKPSKGKIYIDGVDLTILKERQLTKLRRSTIGFIFQFYNLIPVLSAFENVELPMLIAGVPAKEREKRAKELLKMVGLGERLHHRPDELSGGEQQRVAIVRALANKPSIVLADEPTGDLDSKTGKEVVQALRDLSNHEGATVIVVTHDPTVATMATRVFEMRDGLIIKDHKNKVTTTNAANTFQADNENNTPMPEIKDPSRTSMLINSSPAKLGKKPTMIQAAIVATCCLLFYAIGIITNLFALPIFSPFFILSNGAAYQLAYILIAIALGGILIGFIITTARNHRKRK